MDILNLCAAGVNLGGWISQYGKYDITHFNTFITEKDIAQIASWGMDHIRLPLDYPVIEDDAKPFEYSELGFGYIDRCIEWCKKYDLNLIIDLHKAPSYSFDTLDKNNLFTNPKAQERLLKLWEAIAKRYSGEGDNVVFELLNEIVEPNSDRWNKLAAEMIAKIRNIDSKRKIIIGGIDFNAVTRLKEIDVPDDPNMIYTFHFYEPILFTHQKASWCDIATDYNKETKYPAIIEDMEEFLSKYPKYRDWQSRCVGARMDKDLLRKELQPAADFIKSTGKPLYCGEYGAIDTADTQSRINWHRDFIDILKELKIGRACWSYKCMNFGLVDKAGNVVNEEIVKIVSER